MRLFPIFRQPLLAALPALLLAAACSKKDETPAPDQGRVKFIHAAVAVSNASLKGLIDAQEATTVTYATPLAASGYGSGQHGCPHAQVQRGPNQYHPSQPSYYGSQRPELFSLCLQQRRRWHHHPSGRLARHDDLTAPAAGMAKIRFAHFGVGAAATIGVSKAGTGMNPFSAVTADIPYGTVSPFVTIPAGDANLFLTQGGLPVNPLFIPSTKTLVAGKIYTVLLRGTSTNTVTSDELKLDFLENN